MTKGSALRPEVFLANMPSLVADKVAESKGATDEERVLYSMSKSAGWKVLKEYINNALTDLDGVNERVISSGATFEVVGQNQVAINLTKTIIKKIMDRVEDARESVETKENAH